MVMLLLLCVTVTVLPVSIAFYDELNPGWLTVNIITDTLFILDIVVNFRTGILVQTMYPQTVKGGIRVHGPLGGEVCDATASLSLVGGPGAQADCQSLPPRVVHH